MILRLGLKASRSVPPVKWWLSTVDLKRRNMLKGVKVYQGVVLSFISLEENPLRDAGNDATRLRDSPSG